MAYADQEMSGNRITALVIVIILHVLLGWGLISGLAINAVKEVVQRVTAVDIDDPEPEPEEELPPPPEPDTPPPPPPVVAPPPLIDIAINPPPVRSVVEPPPPQPVVADPTPVPEPTPPSLARPAQADNLRRWSSRIQGDYPRRALNRGIEGNVGVTVTIGTDGRVQSCTVSSSSGESVLDRAACQGMERYARYDPALNAAGQPTTGSARMTIQYNLD